MATVVIRRKVQESAEITSFYLYPSDGGQVVSYLPGQYVSLRLCLPELKLLLPRQYSLSSASNGTYYHIAVKRESGLDCPDWGSWGGRYERYLPRTEKWFAQPETRPLWTNAQDEVFGLDSSWHTGNQETIWRWREAYQNDFSARMDWTIRPCKEANHPPVPKLTHSPQLTAKAGDRVNLSAAGSTDPDDDSLTYSWFYYDEPRQLALSTGRSGTP